MRTRLRLVGITTIALLAAPVIEAQWVMGAKGLRANPKPEAAGVLELRACSGGPGA